MLRKIAVFFLVLFILTILPISAVYADDPFSSALPSIDNLFDGRVNSPYLSTYRESYSLDMIDYNFFKDPTGAIDNVMNMGANLLFSLQRGLVYVAIVIYYYAFEISFYEMFQAIISQFISEMQVSLFEQFSLIGIVILGLFLAFKIMQSQKTQVWIAIMQTVL